LFLRKRAPGQARVGEAWLNLAPIQTADGEISINEYFAKHPEMMLGEMNLEGTMYRGQEPTLTGSLSPSLLARAVTKLPEGAYVPRDEGRGPPKPVPQAADTSGVKEGGFVERDGALFVRCGNSFEPTDLGASVAARVRGML